MSNKVYAGNLSPLTTEDELREVFAAYGDVASVTIITERGTELSRDFGYVGMATDEEAGAAVRGMNGTELGGRTISVGKPRFP